MSARLFSTRHAKACMVSAHVGPRIQMGDLMVFSVSARVGPGRKQQEIHRLAMSARVGP